MAVLRVREYTALGRSANSAAVPLTQEPARVVTQVDTTGGEQTVTLAESTTYVKIEVWSGNIANGLRYHVAASPDSTGTAAGAIPPTRMPTAFGVQGGLVLALSEA